MRVSNMSAVKENEEPCTHPSKTRHTEETGNLDWRLSWSESRN